MDGALGASARRRNDRRARRVVLEAERARRGTARSDRVDVAVHHLDNPEGAARLVSALRSRVTDCEITVTEVSAVIGVHVGPGMLGVVVSPQV